MEPNGLIVVGDGLSVLVESAMALSKSPSGSMQCWN